MATAKLLMLSLLAALLAACVGTPERQLNTAGWQAHSERLATMQTWTANGKLAIRTEDSSESASLVWQQRQRHTHLLLSGPLGMGATTIDSDGQQLDIQRGDEHITFDISTPDAIFLNTGWDLPLHALTYWLKGLPTPDTEIQSLEVNTQTQLLDSLLQDGWQIRFEKYAEFDGYILPTRLQIQRGATRAKLIIARWQPADN